MVYLLARTSVADRDAWRTAFDSNDDYRTEHGEVGSRVFYPRDAPDDVVALFEWDDDVDPVAFFDSEGMRARMREAGVRDRPTMTVLDEATPAAQSGPSA